jgi:hypothetical protein
MSKPPRKSIFDLLLPLAPKATPEDEAEARRLGVTVDEYRARKLETQFGVAWQEAGKNDEDDTPPDIREESDEARRLRMEPGVFKPRNKPPSLIVQAAKTPGEVAKVVIFVLIYLVAMIVPMMVAGKQLNRLPGIFQAIGLGLLIIPVMWATGRVWEAMGEGARDVCRVLVRFWPLTLIALLFALGVLKMILGGVPGGQ